MRRYIKLKSEFIKLCKFFTLFVVAFASLQYIFSSNQTNVEVLEKISYNKKECGKSVTKYETKIKVLSNGVVLNRSVSEEEYKHIEIGTNYNVDIDNERIFLEEYDVVFFIYLMFNLIAFVATFLFSVLHFCRTIRETWFVIQDKKVHSINKYFDDEL